MTRPRWIPIGDYNVGDEERRAIAEVLDSGRLSEGRQVARFEREFAAYVGSEYCVAVNSGTSALIVMLKALEHLKGRAASPGQGIITSPLTFIATAAAVVAAGFEPVFADVDPRRFCIRPETVSEVLGESKGASSFAGLMPVHLMGYPADLARLGQIARDHRLHLLEDSAQAHGSVSGGRRTGSIGLAGAFSFYVAHNIQVGEMGAVTTSDAELAGLVRSLKAHGRRCACRICVRREGKCPWAGRKDEGDPRFTHDYIGYNFKTTEMQAALALCQLGRAGYIVASRHNNVRMLNELLAPFRDDLELPALEDGVSYLAYPLVLKEEARLTRANLCDELEKQGVETRPLFSCLPTQQPAFKHLRRLYEGRLPNAERLGSQAFYIGCHQFLGEEDLRRVAMAFRAVLDQAARRPRRRRG